MPAGGLGAAASLPPGVQVLERGWLSSNNVVIRGREQAAVVDTGYATHAAQTLGLVQAAVGECSLSAILNTHLHSDHCGGNAALQAAYPWANIWIPPGLSQAVEHWDPVALTFEPTGQVCPRFGFQQLLVPGSQVELGDLRWEVHAAPGHDPHSVVLFEPGSRCLLSADALWENGFGVVFPELEGQDAFEEVRRTLQLIEQLSPAVVVPGHGQVFTDVGAALARAHSRLDAYEESPARHASHAAKVLLKFKLLELQEVDLADLLRWAVRTPYFALVHGRWFLERDLESWIRGLVNSLVGSGAARLDGERLSNI